MQKAAPALPCFLTRCRSPKPFYHAEKTILPLLLSLLVLGAIFYLLGLFPKVDAAKLAVVVRKWGAVLIAFAAGMIATRNIGLALMASMLTYTFIQKTGWLPWGGSKQSAGGNVSTVRTAYLEMSLDHATGAMTGRVLQGRFAGRALSNMTAAE